jgi:hypothetical protein
MPDDTKIWTAKRIAAMMDRLRHANVVTLQQLRRSFEQIAFSEALLKLPVPKVWHQTIPNEPPTE